MPQPAEVAQLAQQLIDLFTEAQAGLTRRIAEAATDQSRARLRALQQAVNEALDQLEADAAAWFSESMPAIYELGGTDGAASIGDTFAWSGSHLAAVRELAQQTYAEVLSATSFVRANTKRWIRQQARTQTTSALLGGQTAQQAARNLARAAAGDAVEALGGPVLQVLYADGSYRSIADYADMLIRTTSANAYNAGTLNFLGGAGVEFVEILDGDGCGWTSHDDGDKANGTVRPLREAMLHSLSHPRCRRSFAGRPDVTSPGQAAAARSVRAPESMADQAAAEAQRAAGFAQRANARRTRAARQTRRAQTPARLRGTRTARSARTPRASTGGGGAPPRLRAPSPAAGGPLPRLDDILAKPPGSKVIDELRPVFEQDMAGVSVRLDSARRATTGINLDGSLYDTTTGEYIGRIVREIREHDDGARSVYNALLTVEDHYQGQGFVTEYFAHLEDWYRANGISFIDVHANIDVGGYAWATKGFDWQPVSGRPDMGNVPTRLARELVVLPDGAERDAGQAILDRLTDPSAWWTDRMVSPNDIAQLGRLPGMGRDDMWIGKRAMLNSSWHGRKQL